MIGLSGGGWATVLAAATDNRINHSFPVAGTLPLNLRMRESPVNVQGYPIFYDKFPYLDLYLLGSTGDNRSLIQISFFNDSCCFSGDRTLLYSKYLRDLSKKLNGNFNTKIFNVGNHSVDRNTSEFIHNSILDLDSK